MLAPAVFFLGCEPPANDKYGGYIEAEQIEVGSRVGGRVKDVFVEEGDVVEAGTVLVRFETRHLEAELKEAEHKVERLQVVVEKLQAGPRPQEIEMARQRWKAAEARRKNSQDQYNRSLELGSPTVTREKMEEQETILRTDEADERARREELAMLEEGTRAEDVVIAQRELEEAQARVLRLQDQLEEGEVKAPVTAEVEVLDLEPGDLVPPGLAVATLVRQDELWVRCFVPATEITFLKTGDPVQVSVDSRPDRFEGQILRINRVAEYTPRNVQTFEQRADQVFGVKVRVNDPQGVLRPGMAASVRLTHASGNGTANAPHP
jgi:multidrug resistance efflux pump